MIQFRFARRKLSRYCKIFAILADGDDAFIFDIFFFFFWQIVIFLKLLCYVIFLIHFVKTIVRFPYMESKQLTENSLRLVDYTDINSLFFTK